VVGRAEPVTLHELVREDPDGVAATDPDVERFEAALAAFDRGAFEQAAERFRDVIRRTDGGDGPASFYVDRCEQLARDGVGPDWDGVITAGSK
jgi:hypothetical protein